MRLESERAPELDRRSGQARRKLTLDRVEQELGWGCRNGTGVCESDPPI
jgi:hypothetical protein